MEVKDERRLLTMSDLMDMLGVSRSTMYRILNDGMSNFPQPVIIGRRRRWIANEVFAWINARGDAPGPRSGGGA